MRRLFPPVVCLGLLAMACDGCNAPVFPTALSQPAPPASPRPLTPPTGVGFAEPYAPITVGEVVTRLVTDDDPRCVGFPEFRCLYFRLAAPITGNVEAVVTTTRGVGAQLQDVSIAAGGAELWGPVGGRVSAAVRADTIYQITVWYAAPGVEFELRATMRPD